MRNKSPNKYNGSNHCGRICWINVECRLNKCYLRSIMRAVCVRYAYACATNSSQVVPRAVLLCEQLLMLSCKLMRSWLPVEVNYPSSMYIEQSCCTRGSPTCTWSTRITPRHRSKNLSKHLPPKFPYCSTNEGTSSSSPISCPFNSHVFCLEKWNLLKHLMPPYWSDMSGIYFLWLHASQSDGSLFLTVYKVGFVRLFEHSFCLNVWAPTSLSRKQ